MAEYRLLEWMIEPEPEELIMKIFRVGSQLDWYCFVDNIARNEQGLWILYMVARFLCENDIERFVLQMGAQVQCLPLPPDHRTIGPSLPISAMPEFLQLLQRLGIENKTRKIELGR